MKTTNAIIQEELEENEYLFLDIPDKYLKQRVQVCFRWYVKKAVRNKRGFYVFSTFTIVCPILAEIILQIPGNAGLINLIVSIIMGISAIAAALSGLYGVKFKWSLYRDQAEKIKSYASKYAEGDIELEEFARALENSVSETHDTWKHENKKEK